MNPDGPSTGAENDGGLVSLQSLKYPSRMARDFSRFLNAVEPQIHHFEDDGDIPNNPRLPLICYPQVIVEEDRFSAPVLEEMFAANGWPDSWRNGVYPFPHYHAQAHEVLGCYGGRAKVRLGGMNGIVQEIRAGDVVILPAGVGHENLGASADFAVVGSYPEGQSPDMCRGGGRPEGVLEAIHRVPLPAADPVLGGGGGTTNLWK